jgi:hypothetical protein
VTKAEAKEIMARRLQDLRALSYESLLELQSPVTETVEAPSGRSYQLEVQAFWDDRRKQTLRVMVSIDDGSLRSFAPLSNDFIVAPDGTFVGE